MVATTKTEQENTLELDAVGMRFEGIDAPITLFDSLSLKLHAGECVAITGPSGVGKSSLLSLAAGLEVPTEGSVRWRYCGRSVTGDERRKLGGFVFQQFHLLPELDALNNVALPLLLRGDREAIAQARHWLQRVGLADRCHHRPSALSGGEQQRVAIARALITRPLWIFADEPTGNLDEATAKQISDLLFETIAEIDAGMLLVTHSERLAARADRWLTLKAGALSAQTSLSNASHAEYAA